MIIITMYNNIHILLSTKLTTPDTTINYTANHNISTIYNNIFPYHYTKRHSNQPPQLQRLAKNCNFICSWFRCDTFQYVKNKGTDQTALMHRLIYIFVVYQPGSQISLV